MKLQRKNEKLDENHLLLKIQNKSTEQVTNPSSEVLEYTDYRKFLNVIDKAKMACENSGEVIHSHFVDANEMVTIRSEAEKPVVTLR